MAGEGEGVPKYVETLRAPRVGASEKRVSGGNSPSSDSYPTVSA